MTTDLPALLAAEAAAQQAVDQAIVELRATGSTWHAISQASGLSQDALRWRWQRAGAATAQPQPKTDAALSSDTPLPEGEVTVAAAAAALGVSRPTVHRRAASGALRARRDSRGVLHVSADAITT